MLLARTSDDTTAIVQNDKHDVNLLAYSPFIINEQKVAFAISAYFHTGHSVPDKQQTATHMKLFTYDTTRLGDSDCSPRVAVLH
jgi:hypothetical protein